MLEGWVENEWIDWMSEGMDGWNEGKIKVSIDECVYN